MTEKLPMPSAEEMRAVLDRFCGHRTNAYPRKGPSIMGPNDTLRIRLSISRATQSTVSQDAGEKT